jgi:hypothetical protein
MRKSTFALCIGQLLLAALLVSTTACGDDDDDIIPPSPDGGMVVLPPETCDIAAQDCPEATDKCTVALNDANTNMPWSSVCRSNGTVALGAMCARETEGSAGVGRDNCLKGTYCTALGTLSGNFGVESRKCRSFCRGAGTCGANEFCRPLTTGVTVIDGICIPGCTPVSGTECTDGAWCLPINDYDATLTGECTPGGTAKDGEHCDSDAEIYCEVNHLCIVKTAMPEAPFCAQFCSLDGNLPCAEGKECQALNGVPEGFGTCGDPVAASDAGAPQSFRLAFPQ